MLPKCALTADWPNDDTRAQVPADIATCFPGLVAHVPRAFERHGARAPAVVADRLGGDSPQADAPEESPDAAKP